MSTATPLVFRPSLIHRALAALLCAGSWLVGIRAMVFLVQHFPHLIASIQMAKFQGEFPWNLWIVLVAEILACAVGGLLLLAAILALLLIEGSQVIVDDLGIMVEHNALPGPLARSFGAGRLGWKQVTSLEKRRFFFVILGGGVTDPGAPAGGMHTEDPTLRFLVVDHLERLIFLIFERSPNLRGSS